MAGTQLNAWYEKGVTFEQYVEGMKVNREEVTRVYEQLVFSVEDRALWKELAEKKWRGIVLTAD
jgi:hypothetical protein